MKICSLYGVGFYYIPGTDMCLKIGGWVRAEYTWGAAGSIGVGAFQGAGNINSRSTSNSVWRARGYITADARSQTEYGTVRGYIAVGVSGNDVDGTGNVFDANRAFIQWAGFTFGQAQSFFDFYSGPATAYWGTYPSSDTGDPGWKVLGYTAQFGNGFSATIAAEMRRNTRIIRADTVAALALSTFSTSQYGGFNSPDIVGNLRVDQAWGSAQIMAAAHQVNSLYYETPEVSGHPDDKWGFALGAGIKLNAPMLGAGDFFQTQVTYTQGAARYAFFATQGNWFYRTGDNLGFGLINDAVYGGTIAGANTTNLELTTAWAVNAAYDHHWNARWKTSLYGGYAQVNYGDSANNMICAAGGDGTGAGSLAVANAGCNMDWSTWWVGSRTQWNVTKDFYMGLDVLYNRLQTANSSTGLIASPTTVVTGPLFLDDQDNFQFRFRVHRDFYP